MNRPPREFPRQTLGDTVKKECKWPRRHVWKIRGKEQLASTMDMMRATGMTKFKSSGYETLEGMAYRPHLITYRCERCGTEKVDRV